MAQDVRSEQSNALDVDAVVAHFVHAMAGAPPSKGEIFRHLKGSLRWKEAAAAEAISRCLDRRTLSLREGDSSDIVSGDAFDPDAFPRERVLAARAATRARREPHVEKTQYLRDAILAELSPRSAKSTGELWMALQETFGGGGSGRRKLERYLVDLEKLDQVERDSDGWRDAREKDDLSEHVTYAALRMLNALVDDLVPFDLQRAIATQLRKAEEKLKALSHHDPAARWVRAFRIMPPRHHLDDPVIDADVKNTIEEAILTHRKVRLKWSDVRYDENHDEVAYVEEQDCSVSHYLIEVPANPSIEIWYGDRWKGGEVPNRLLLSDVLEAQILPVVAEYPADYEPEMFPKRIGMKFGDADQHRGETLVTLAMSRATYSTLLRKKLGELLTIVEEERDGRMIVSFRYPLDLPITRYFEQLPGVSVLGPKLFRAFAMAPTRARMREYKETAELAQALGGEEEALAQELEHLRAAAQSK